MNEYKLRRLLGQIVLAVLPLPTAVGCGGVAGGHDTAGDGEGGDAGRGGTSTAGKGGTAGSGAGAAGRGGQGGTTGSGGAGGTAGAEAGTGGIVQGGAGGLSCQGAPSDCMTYQSVTIDRRCVEADTGTLDPEQCAFICNRTLGCPCGSVPASCSVLSQEQETVTIACSPSCFVGRRPAAFVASDEHGLDLGAQFARAAELEALAVVAFRNLRAELAELGAPRRLLRALTSAARDEVRHARSTRRLARRFGGRTLLPRALPRSPRSLEAIALENAVEGCVRETYGALSAVWQAHRAEHPAVRSALRKIARDEIRHAALSMRVQRWLEPRLDPNARRRVAEARSAALAALRAELAIDPPPDTVRLAGYPDRAQAARLVEELAARLWS